jgi:2-oxo-4-hydroxy-4-carboxy-5-ureidoimidazoline decarboxylase
MERWRAIDAAPVAQAQAMLRVCCGSPRWIGRMLAGRPFGSRERALRLARDEWFALEPADWQEAFAHHPRIGDVEALRERFPASGSISEKEQAGVAAAAAGTLDALLEGNRAYEARFGYIFIVCASGRTAAEMLDILRARLANDPADEIRIAAEEQARICERRLLAQA